jgi:glycosyltransferase involved in cell wall biosynthesis
MAENSPTVSVIIPTYNRAQLLSRSIQSVLNQTYQDFEIIIVDDASTDDTEEVISNLDNEKIRYLRHEKNKGAAAARNTGIKAARGSYIAFQDSDDEWLFEKLEKQMKIFETAPPNVGVVYTGYYRIKGNDITYVSPLRHTKRDGDVHEQILRKGGLTCTQSIVVPKYYLEKVGMFDENLPRLQDLELTIRLSKHYHFKFINEPLLKVYYTEVSISADQDALVKASMIVLEKHFKEYNKDKRLIANYYYRYGNFLCMSGDIKKGRNFLYKAVKAFPFDYKPIIKILLSSLGPTVYKKVLESYQKLDIKEP